MPAGASIKMAFRLLVLLFLVVNNAFAENICVRDKGNIAAQEGLENYFSANGFDVSEDISRQYKIYFDTPELLLLNSDYSLRFLGTEYHSKKSKQKFHEFVEFFSGQNQQDVFSVKHYKNVESLEEKHPLIFLVKRKERSQFLEKIKNSGVKYPQRLREVFQASDIVRKVAIDYEGISIGFIESHEMIVISQEKEIPLSLLELKLNQELISKLPADIKEMIKGYTDEIRCDYDTEYKVLFSIMEDEIDYFELRLAHPYFINLLFAFSLALIGVFVLKILFWGRLKSQ